MSQLELVAGERVTSDGSTTSATYTAMSSPVLAAASFVVGKKYLLIVRSEVANSAFPVQSGIRVTHGGTAFTRSEMLYTNALTANERTHYSFVTVWTAVSGEAIELQLKSNGTDSAKHRWTTLLAIRLTDSLTENTDWFFNENTTPATLTTSAVTGATVTFTPATAGHRWLVLTDGQLELDNVNDEFVSRLDHTGGATEGWDAIYGGRAAGDLHSLPGMWVGTLGAVSQTYRQQHRRIGTTGSTARHMASAVFCLDLDKCDVAEIDLTDAQFTPGSATNWGDTVATVSHAQAVNNGNVLLLGYQQFSPLTDTSSIVRTYTARLQIDNVDAFSADGVTNTYTGSPPPLAGFSRFGQPITGSVRTGQAIPYLHASLEVLPTGTQVIDMDFGESALAAGGTRYRRLLALSLDVAAAPPPAGAGGAQGSLERNEQIMYLNDPVAARRRVLVRCVDATDNVTAETGEAGGQPAISINGGAFTTTGVGVLVAVESSNGLYYTELTVAALSAIGSVRVRYKTAATALFTATLAIELLPVLYDGLASAGGANTVSLSSPPSYVQPGTIVRIVDGTGKGQSMLALSFSTPAITMEGNWDTTPDATSHVILEPGLPLVIPAANMVQVNGSASAAAGLQKGAEEIQTGVIRTGANSLSNLVTSLPTIVNSVAVGPNFYANRGLIVKTGNLRGDQATIIASVTSGSDTILTLSGGTLTATPAVGVEFVVF